MTDESYHIPNDPDLGIVTPVVKTLTVPTAYRLASARDFPFRRCAFATWSDTPAWMRLRLHDLQADAEYAIVVFDVPGTTVAKGRELMTDGLSVTLENKPAAATVLYEKRK